jgi:hypothetical protein
LLPSSRILNTTLFESWEIIGPYPSWWLFNGLLLILQVLHIIWSYLIARIAFKALIRGKVRMKEGLFLWAVWEHGYYSTHFLFPFSLISPTYTSRFNRKPRAPESFVYPFKMRLRCKRKT